MSSKTSKISQLIRFLVGIISAGVLFVVSSALAQFFSPVASPVTSLGATFIDFTPGWLKNFAISTFGTNDKLVLLISIAVVIVIVAGIVGILAARRFAVGASAVVLLAVVIAACILSRNGARIVDLIPLVIGTITAILALRFLTPSNLATASNAPATSQQLSGPNRRAILIRSAVVSGGVVLLGVGGTLITQAANRSKKLLGSVKLPLAKKSAAALPANVQSSVEGVGAFVTPNEDFYRIDTALVVPQIDPAEWELRVHGMVEKPFTMNFNELLAQDLVESYTTLTCVSNVVGGDLAGNAKWLGYPLREVLARAKPKAGANMVLSTSHDGFSASTPLEALQDDRQALLAVGMNGEPLPLAHGFPVRMVVPGLYGFVSATKWVVDLEVTTFDQSQGYWTSRGWSSHGPIKTASRIEVPKALARIPAGTVGIGGTAWAQTRGIEKVEISIDSGPWQAATLSAEANLDCWRQWGFTWEGATAGTHKVQVRAWDKTGKLQVENQAPPEPDGSTGWHSITFTVT